MPDYYEDSYDRVPLDVRWEREFGRKPHRACSGCGVVIEGPGEMQVVPCLTCYRKLAARAGSTAARYA